MGALTEEKLKKFLKMHKPGTVCLASWLETLGISHDLQKKYRKSGWLESIGRGTFKRPGEEIGWQGGVYALQFQAGLPVHVGALTALILQGAAHYTRLGGERIYLFSPTGKRLPSWFQRHDWGALIEWVGTSFLPEEKGLAEWEEKTFSIKISTPERAILECLYLAPARMDIEECLQLVEGLTTMRPRLIQSLLEECASIKAKRLFLYMADKAGHSWVRFLDQSRIDLGKGDRSLVKGGVYIPKFKISIPKELAAR